MALPVMAGIRGTDLRVRRAGRTSWSAYLPPVGGACNSNNNLRQSKHEISIVCGSNCRRAPAWRRMMSNEQFAFGARLRAALQHARVVESPSHLARLLARFGGEPVSPQAVSSWLRGRAMPRQANLKALAKMLALDPQQLQFGEQVHGAARPGRAALRLHPDDRLALEAFLGLSARQRRLVRELIDEFAALHGRRGEG